MAETTPSQTLANINKLHSQLSSQLTSLRKALAHWQTQEIDYESIREQLSALPDDADTPTIKAALDSADCEAINAADINDILRFDKDGNITRNPSQIASLISRRIDYVSRNAETLTKQIAAAQAKLENVEEVQRVGIGVTHEEGEAVMDIQEDLDDDGKVIRSRVGVPKDAAGDLLDALGKMGVTGQEDSSQAQVEEITEEDDEEKSKGKVREAVKKQTQTEADPGWTFDQDTSVKTVGKKPVMKAVEPVAASKTAEAPIKDASAQPKRKKSVTFAPETKQPDTASSTPSAKSHTSGTVELPTPSPSTAHTLPNSTIRAQRFHLSSDSPLLNPPSPSNAATPETIPKESDDDAALRAEMLRYTMDENRAVVAQMDLLDDDGSDDSSYWSDETIEEWNDDLDENAVAEGARRRALDRGESAMDEADDDDEEEENEHGVSLKSHITDDLRREMLALEEKLKAQGLMNAGPSGRTLTSTGWHADATHDDKVVSDGAGDTEAAKQAKILRVTSDGGTVPDPELWGDDPRILDLMDRGPPPQNQTPATKVAASSSASGTGSGSGSGSGKSKGVRFAPELDIAPTTPNHDDRPIAELAPTPTAAPFSSTIIERSPLQSSSSTLNAQRGANQLQRQSRFKSARQAAPASSSSSSSSPLPSTIPSTGDGAAPLSNTIHERQTPQTQSTSRRDAAMLHRDLAHQRREIVNKLVERQGGYLSEDVAQDVEGEEEEKGKRVSRFKAARLRA